MKRLPIAMALGALLVVSASAGTMAKPRAQQVEDHRTCFLLELMGKGACADAATDQRVGWPAPPESLSSPGGESVAPSNGFAGGSEDESTPNPTPVPIPR